jgi:hypothetical protein
MTLMRYFGGFVHSQTEHLPAVLGEFAQSRVSAPPLSEVFEPDSTVFKRYGQQEGALNGHKP